MSRKLNKVAEGEQVTDGSALPAELQDALVSPEADNVLKELKEVAGINLSLAHFLNSVESGAGSFIEEFRRRGMFAQAVQMKSLLEVGRACAKHMRDKAVHEKLQ